MLSSQPYPPSPHRTRRLTKDLSPDTDMRGLGPADTQAGRKPSKLELMRADYQRKLLKEKEEKMVQLYEDNQKKAMMRVTRNGSGSGRNGIATPPGTVRDFFNERRRLAASGMPMPSIDNHYKQAKGSSSPGDWSSRAGSGNSVHAQKVSAGRDRSQPLVPIHRGGDEATNNNNTSGIPLRRTGSNCHVDKNPFDSKPRLVKHAPLPPTNGHMDKNNNDGVVTGAKPSHLPRFTPQNRSQPQPTSQKAVHNPHPPAEHRGPPDQGKLTDFQKWQLEQNKAREKRLKKLNHKQHADDGEGVWADPEEEPRFAVNLEETNDQEDEDGKEEEEESHVPNAKIKELEKQLLDKIAREQAELKRLKMERQKEEEEEKRELERQKKKEAAERAKQKKQEEERRKEEEKRRRKEEADEKLEREREERRERQQMEEERRRKEEEKKRLKMTNSRRKEDNKVDDEGLSDEDDDVAPSKTSSVPQVRHQAKQKPKDKMDDFEETALSVSDANYYAQAAASSEAKGQVGSLAKCSICGRSFAHDRIQKHRDACAKASKPRKEFDSSKKRVEGTELAKYAGKAKKSEPPKKKSNWRTHHEQFIESLRYAKKVTQIEKEGGDLRSLAPPPRTVNPDLVPCPHCGRTFNETAAERHIPRCQTLKTRPAPVNNRRR